MSKKQVENYNMLEEWSKKWQEMFVQKLDDSIIGMLTKVEPRKFTPAEIKQQKAREKKEKIRRAKKMTLTVGEYEDLIESSYY